jgi:hypothetical protein
MAYTKYSLTPANNNAAPPDGAPEGMLPSAVNDTMRDMMAQIRDVGDGIRGGTYTMTAPVITGGSVSGVTALTTSGNLTFTGTGNRITGDFSNATVANRVAIQSSTTNGTTGVFVLPNGTSTQGQVLIANNSDPTNAGLLGLTSLSTDARVAAGITGTGTYLPLTMFTGGNERLRIDTSGRVGIGTSSPYALLTVAGNIQLGTPAQNATTAVSIVNNTVSDPATTEKAAITLGTTAGASSSSSYISFTTNSYGVSRAERMRIDPLGNVGIGTSTGVYKLDVVTSQNSDTAIRVYNANTGASARAALIFGADTSATTAGLYYNSSNNTAMGGAYSFNISQELAAPMTFRTNATERMRIASGGDVYITNGSFVSPPTSGNDVWAGGLVVNPTRRTTGNSGNTYWDPSTGAYFRSTSSLRYKKEVQNATHGIAEVLQLRPVTYKGKAESDGDKVFGGFIAEEIDALGLTEFVQYDTEGRPDSLAYSNMVSLLAKAIQEQQVMITELKATVDAQAARIAALESN